MAEGEVVMTYDQWLEALRLRGYDATRDPAAFRQGYDSGISPDTFAHSLSNYPRGDVNPRVSVIGGDPSLPWILAALVGIATFGFIAYCILAQSYISNLTYQAISLTFTVAGSICGISLLHAKGRKVSYAWLLLIAFSPLWILLALLWSPLPNSRWLNGLSDREPFNRSGAITLALVMLVCFVALAVSPIVAVTPIP